MMIEITGGGTQNKGAQLMLLCTLKQLGQRIAHASFCCPAHGPYDSRAAYGLWQSFPKKRVEGRYQTALEIAANNVFARLIRRNSRMRYGLIAPWETDGLVDISGSQFSDAWPVIRVEGFAQLMWDYKRRGKPVVLLPQMFGKFPTERARNAMKRAIDHCDLAYARDGDSLRMLTECVGQRDNVRLAPDITIFATPAPPPVDAVEKPYACVVPNTRMLEQGKAQWGDSYVALLEGVIQLLKSRGLRVLLTLHDTKGQDIVLCRQIMQRVGSDACELFSEPDPLQLKGVISGARLIVASRYHSIVGALSMGVPAVTLGWAHKYPGLLNDFGVPELIHKHDQPAEHLMSLVSKLCDDEKRAAVSARLSVAKERMKQAAMTMWDDVARTLSGDRSSKK